MLTISLSRPEVLNTTSPDGLEARKVAKYL